MFDVRFNCVLKISPKPALAFRERDKERLVIQHAPGASLTSLVLLKHVCCEVRVQTEEKALFLSKAELVAFLNYLHS